MPVLYWGTKAVCEFYSTILEDVNAGFGKNENSAKGIDRLTVKVVLLFFNVNFKRWQNEKNYSFIFEFFACVLGLLTASGF
jgi:hypothetical protein